MNKRTKKVLLFFIDNISGAFKNVINFFKALFLVVSRIGFIGNNFKYHLNYYRKLNTLIFVSVLSFDVILYMFFEVLVQNYNIIINSQNIILKLFIWQVIVFFIYVFYKQILSLK